MGSILLKGGKMKRWNDESYLEVVEKLAEYEGFIPSEEELSQKFDEEVALLVIAEYGENDRIAIRVAFNDWSDALCKDGEIHPEQYNSYCYVGRYK